MQNILLNTFQSFTLFRRLIYWHLNFDPVPAAAAAAESGEENQEEEEEEEEEGSFHGKESDKTAADTPPTSDTTSTTTAADNDNAKTELWFLSPLLNGGGGCWSPTINTRVIFLLIVITSLMEYFCFSSWKL